MHKQIFFPTGPNFVNYVISRSSATAEYTQIHYNGRFDHLSITHYSSSQSLWVGPKGKNKHFISTGKL